MSISNLVWSRASAEILAKLGVRHVCISPGSRNSPLTIGLTEQKNLKCFSFIDERSSAFFALGIAKPPAHVQDRLKQIKKAHPNAGDSLKGSKFGENLSY